MHIYTNITGAMYLGNPPDMVSADILSRNVSDIYSRQGSVAKETCKFFIVLSERESQVNMGVATISRLLQITGLFCRI